MGEPFAWIGVLVLIGFIGFFIMSVVLVGKFLGFLFRAVFGAPEEHAKKRIADHKRSGPTCENPHCRHPNPPQAYYCGRCGRSIRRGNDVSTYG